jgi:hypothetical protein
VRVFAILALTGGLSLIGCLKSPYPPHHGVRDNADDALDPVHPTLAQTLMASSCRCRSGRSSTRKRREEYRRTIPRNLHSD